MFGAGAVEDETGTTVGIGCVDDVPVARVWELVEAMDSPRLWKLVSRISVTMEVLLHSCQYKKEH